VLGIDPRVTDRPAGMADLATPDRLEERVGEADFVILTTPETPDTVGMFNTRLFTRMKRDAYFINIARGRCVVTADLVEALRSGHLAGAGLDAADPEPLPPDHPALEHAKRADHAACRDLRHSLSREMGGDVDRELPTLCRRATPTQPHR
jgi:phosphoglycerate dehydrogenase-like enzyme